MHSYVGTMEKVKVEGPSWGDFIMVFCQKLSAKALCLYLHGEQLGTDTLRSRDMALDCRGMCAAVPLVDRMRWEHPLQFCCKFSSLPFTLFSSDHPCPCTTVGLCAHLTDI